MQHDSTGVPTLLKDGKEFITAASKANVLKDHFQSVFTSEDLTIPSIDNSVPTISSITLSTEGIATLLSKLDTNNKSPGPDQIPSYTLKHCANEIALVLQVIYNQSLHSAQLPAD